MVRKKENPTTKRKRPSKKAAVKRATSPKLVPPAVQNEAPAVTSPSYRIERWSSPGAPNPAMLRNVLSREGYTVYQWSDPAGTVYGMHRHETAQSHWIISGELEIRVEGRGAFTLTAGDRDLMPAATYHSARVIGEEPVLYLIGELL